MKNKNTLWIVGGAVAVAAIGFFLLKKFTAKAEGKVDEIQSPEKPTETPEVKPQPQLPILGDPLANIGAMVTNFLTTYNPYTVNTISSSLYLRETPDAKGKIIGKYAKGTVITAKASGTKGWFAVTEDGKNIKGYVSATYLKAAPKK